MNDFTFKNSTTKVINTAEYQEYLEYLEEEAMAKHPEDFCFQAPNRDSYTESELDIFAFENQLNEDMAILSNENLQAS